MNRKTLPLIASAALAGLLWGSGAWAQNTEFGLIDGSIVFLDPEGDSRCGAVNTINADFFIRSCDRRLILLRGDDRETPFTTDYDYAVFNDDGEGAGKIRFASDRDGFRQVFWVSDDSFPEGENFVLRYDLDTDEVSVEVVEGQGGELIPVAPVNITGTECDPTVSFDGGDTLLCPRACGSGMGLAMLAIMCCLGLMGHHLPTFGRLRRGDIRHT